MTLFQFGVVIVKTLLIFAFVMAVMVPLLIWLERRLQGRMQHRLGPNRVGPLGLFQPIADAIKLVLKEDITPAGVSKALYYLAPVLSMVPAFLVFAVIPFGSEVSVAGHVVTGSLADINVALLFLLAMSSLGVYGIVLAGWSSNNKWSLLGAVRSVAQLVSYELPMGFALLGPVLIVGSLSLTDMVDFQAGGHWL
ncbi:MAG: NADH-quinone oxidoreductase subunit H, partial [Armatimonadota bacterium]